MYKRYFCYMNCLICGEVIEAEFFTENRDDLNPEPDVDWLGCSCYDSTLVDHEGYRQAIIDRCQEGLDL